MKTHIKLRFLPYLILGILSMTACNKNEGIEEDKKPNIEKIIGTWQLTDGDYNGTITFEEGTLLAYDYFTHETHAGISMYEWSLVDNQLSMTLFTAKGDYCDYNEIAIGAVRNYIVEVTDNELTINYDGVAYLYTRLASENFISETDIEGSWEIEDGNYRGLITFDVISESWNNIGAEAFMASADSGAANFSWNVNGNWVFVSYEHLFGDFESYNEIGANKLIISKVSTADNKITFSVNDESYIYTRVLENNILSKNDLLGSWKLTEGTQTEIISFNLSNYYSSGSSSHSFIDGTLSGVSIYNYWTVSGDIFTIRYQGGVFDDYSSNFGIEAGESISTRISSSNNQITFHTTDGDYSYTHMAENEIITNSEIVGTWEITDGDYTGELIFNENGTGSDSFIDGTQSGTADFACIFNGNMLRLNYTSTTGNYESYNQISSGESIYMLLSLAGNQLTFTNDGVNYVYTKKTN